MSRPSDPVLQDKILMAARKLWTKGGDEGLSMRAIAKAARTNTPAIYRRFKTRKDILRALVEHLQQELLRAVQPSRSLEEIGERTLAFALAHPQEYQLFSSGALARVDAPRVNFELVKQRCAEWFGGSPDDHATLVLGLWSVVHGTAMLLISKTVPKTSEAAVHRAFASSLRVLIRNRTAFSEP